MNIIPEVELPGEIQSLENIHDEQKEQLSKLNILISIEPVDLHRECYGTSPRA